MTDTAIETDASTSQQAESSGNVIAISGGSGLVGTALTQRLVRSGRQVAHLVRDASAKRSVNTILWDPQAGVQEIDKLENVVAIVHLAGRSIGAARWSDREKALIRDSRVEPTRILSEQIASLELPNLHTFVSASAVGIYGDQADREVGDAAEATDSLSIEPTFLSEVAKEWEEAATPAAGKVRVVHPRLGIVLSPEGGALAKMLPLFKFFLGGRVGAGDQWWSWISLRDCVEAIVWLLDNPDAQGPYNLTAPAPVTNSEFTTALASALSRPAFLPAPAPLLRLALGEMADELLLQSCRVLPSRLLSEGFTFKHTDLSDCLSEILQ